jgi:hypothetical protein
LRNGTQIGTHNVQFAREGDRLKATTSIALRVEMFSLTLYRYSHRAEEVWQGDVLQSLVSTTEDNGAAHRVRAIRQDNGLQVWRSSPPEPNQPDRVDNAGIGTTTTLPRDIVPTTHWNIRQVRQSRLLNSQLGTEIKVRIDAVGSETIDAAGKRIEADRFRYSGELVKDHWFDRRGCWAKTSFGARDGSRIDYILQP